MDRAEIDRLFNEINIGYACRALLGEGKGLFTMNEIRAYDPEYYQWLMNEATKRLGVQIWQAILIAESAVTT